MIYHNIFPVSGGDVSTEGNAAFRGVYRRADRGLNIYAGVSPPAISLCAERTFTERVISYHNTI